MILIHKSKYYKVKTKMKNIHIIILKFLDNTYKNS